MVRILKAVPALFFAAFVAAEFAITKPSADIWWVAESLNEIAWTCQESPAESFTVLVNNKDPKIAVAPQAVIAIQKNADCSITISQNQANQPVGTGWTILLADIFNSSHVYATSQEFEIKPLGSLYPSQVTPTGSPVGTAGGSKPTTNSTGAALGLQTSGFMGLAGVVGLAYGFMGL
ncbi:hypothetical protein B0H34DRAFT_712285 [Crassisporium funariophilum]|nr:hypothetical protein B0H34DRAFT_712285 [Crassisporium funariophilum]